MKIGKIFKIADVEFIKFTQDGDGVIAVTKDALFNSPFSDNGNLAESKIRARLESELLPKLEAEIGTGNILEFETDMLAFDGTRTYPNFRSKISLVTLDFYRQHRKIFEAHKLNSWWWLATPDSKTYPGIFLCVSPHGNVNYNNVINNIGVRPVLRFVSSISVSCEE